MYEIDRYEFADERLQCIYQPKATLQKIHKGRAADLHFQDLQPQRYDRQDRRNEKRKRAT